MVPLDQSYSTRWYNGRMNEPVGVLHAISSTEDRTLYAYRPRKRTARGILWLGIALALVGAAIVLGRVVTGWMGILCAILPSIAASAAAYCGMLDLLNRPLFQLEVDRRARTVALAMPREKGHDLAKVKFGDVESVRIVEKGPPPVWNVTLQLKNGRRIGLGVSDDKAQTDDIAARFAEMIGVQVIAG
jgi:hypothetical protein